MATLFFSYSHSDESLRDQLEVHLMMLKREGLIEAWHDRQIPTGDEIASAIDGKLEIADVILLLVSSDFLASSYCFDIEMQRAMQKHQEGSGRVIPVILRPCDWHNAPFGRLLAAPKDGKPITKWTNRDEAFLDVAKQIRTALTIPVMSLTKLRQTKASADNPPRAVPASAAATEGKQHSGKQEFPTYLCYVSQEKVDQLESVWCREETHVHESIQQTSRAFHLDALHDGKLAYGRPDLFQRNIALRRRYAEKLRRLATPLTRLTRSLLHVSSDELEAGLFLWYRGDFYVKAFRKEHGMATLSSQIGTKELLLDCSLRYFSSAVSSGGELLLHSANFAFFLEGLHLTLETTFVLLASTDSEYRGSPIYLQLKASSMTEI